jgi:dTDP-4-dehydrorhamnose reductase
MIFLFGSSGYVGSAVANELTMRGQKWAACSYQSTAPEIDALLRRDTPELVINCAAFIQKSSVDLNRLYPRETILGNVVFPAMLAQCCASLNIPLMHVSTGCLFDESQEWKEWDKPTRGFNGYCGFYVGTKLLSEEVVRIYPKTYILRIRLPFDNQSNPRNYLNKLIAYPKVYEHLNSLTHRGDFAKAALDLHALGADFGTYHMVNPGGISARDVVGQLMNAGLITHKPEFVSDSGTTGCVLSTHRLLMAGVKIRNVHDAVEDAINNWKENV